MDFTALFFTALALSMDAFAVSVSNSMCYGGLRWKQIGLTSFTFGIFQGVMPILGFFSGQLLVGFIETVDHWVALALLGLIGGKMAAEGIRAMRRPDSRPDNPAFTARTMLLQALATSIDALAVGVSFAALSVNIWRASSGISAITFGCCLLGGLLGKKVGGKLGDWAQIFGGLLLVGIGLRIAVEHLAG